MNALGGERTQRGLFGKVFEKKNIRHKSVSGVFIKLLVLVNVGNFLKQLRVLFGILLHFACLIKKIKRIKLKKKKYFVCFLFKY